MEFFSPEGGSVTPWKKDDTGSLELAIGPAGHSHKRERLHQSTPGPIQPNRYGIPRNPKVAQEVAAYRSQKPETPIVRYRLIYFTYG